MLLSSYLFPLSSSSASLIMMCSSYNNDDEDENDNDDDDDDDKYCYWFCFVLFVCLFFITATDTADATRTFYMRLSIVNTVCGQSIS